MMHKTRCFMVVDIDGGAEELAEKLTQHTWTPCTGFRLRGYLFLNDSTSPDGAQEYGIVKGGKQIESITFGWCDKAKGLDYVRRILAGEFDGSAFCDVTNTVQSPAEHGRCGHCA